MVRATLRVIAGLFLGAMLGWLSNDIHKNDRHVYTNISINGNFTPEEREHLRHEADRQAMKEYEKNRNPKQELILSVMSLIFMAMIFGLFTAYSLLFDLEALGLQRHRVDEVEQPSTM